MEDNSWLPPLAPLSKPLADYLAGIDSLPDSGRGRVTVTNGMDLGELIAAHARARAGLIARATAAREAVYQAMARVIGNGPISPVLGSGPLTTRVFLELLQQAVNEIFAHLPPADRPAPTRSTIHRWRNTGNGSGLLRYRDQDDIDPQSAAAILIARRLAQAPHNWLPSGRNHFTAEDLVWWCWCYERPEAQPIACPLSLLHELPTSTLVVTTWEGAAWIDGWQLIPGGAFRWAGTPAVADLERWYADGVLNAPEALKELMSNGQSTSEATTALHALSKLITNGYSTDNAVPVSLLQTIFDQPRLNIPALSNGSVHHSGQSRFS